MPQKYREQLVKSSDPRGLSARYMRTIYAVHEGSSSGAVSEIAGRHRVPESLASLVDKASQLHARKTRRA